MQLGHGMARQKQVDDCLSRCLAGQAPMAGSKLKASLLDGVLTLHHYHHKVLEYRLATRQVLHEWWEKPTDKRILQAALAYLREELPTENSPSASSTPRTSPKVKLETVSLGRFGQCKVARGKSLEDRGSVFVAQLAFPVQSEETARAAIAKMRQNTSAADHNISAFRVASATGGKMVTFSDDDGEDRAGSKLLGLLKTEDAIGVAVVVARWFGGVNLGQARFRHICNSAKDLLVDCGHKSGVAMHAVEEHWGSGQSLTSSSSSAFLAPQSAEQRRALQAAAAERRAEKLAGGPRKATHANAAKVGQKTAEQETQLGPISDKPVRDEMPAVKSYPAGTQEVPPSIVAPTTPIPSAPRIAKRPRQIGSENQPDGTLGHLAKKTSWGSQLAKSSTTANILDLDDE